VTRPNLPDPDRGARFLGKLLEDDPAHLDVATDDEVERMMDAAGVQVKSVPTADELIALAEKRAREQAPAVAQSPRSRARRMSPVALAAVLVLGAGGIVALLNSAAIVAYLKGEPIGPDRPWSPPSATPTPQELAAARRAEAFAACDAQAWDECSRKLDEASAIDPAGEADPRVTAARKAVTDGTQKHEIKPQPKLVP
jgi:hypothetical protein